MLIEQSASRADKSTSHEFENQKRQLPTNSWTLKSNATGRALQGLQCSETLNRQHSSIVAAAATGSQWQLPLWPAA
jgi:hypothetical protein